MVITQDERNRIRDFSGEVEPQLCLCTHKLAATGGIFYHSVGLIQCNNCRGWQLIRKVIT